jgi:asparaginyl-tRNA synthetase
LGGCRKAKLKQRRAGCCCKSSSLRDFYTRLYAVETADFDGDSKIVFFSTTFAPLFFKIGLVDTERFSAFDSCFSVDDPCTTNILTAMQRLKIAHILRTEPVNTEVLVKGWVKAFRNNQFIALNDGSTANNLQVVVDFENTPSNIIERIKFGAAIGARGMLVESQGAGQKVEVKASEIIVYGDCNPDEFPLQPKRQTLEFLREKAHLRFRTNTFAAVFRIRHALAYAVHKFFNDKGFYYLHTPIITASDAEGAGEMFRVTTLDLERLPRTEQGEVDFSQDFFKRSANLTVSGQLEAELGAMALGEVYTFGPTFRAENSNTTRHLAEFWMIEPEVAFNDLNDNMNLAEDMLHYVIGYALEHCADDLKILEDRLIEEEKSKPQDQRSEMSLTEKLRFVYDNEFVRITYTEAIDILKNSNPNKKGKFQFPVEGWGTDLQSEHERYLVEKHFKKPVILTNYPADIKAFYMRQDEPTAGVPGATVSAMDILFPGIGEIVGGSQREERLDRLQRRMQEMHIPEEELYWYLDTRRFGTCPHAGFGLGFERLVLFVTGMTNIRDVIAFPRYPGSAEF